MGAFFLVERKNQEINHRPVRLAYQPPVLFSHNKSAISNQPAVLFSQNKPAPAIGHQPNEQAAKRLAFFKRNDSFRLGSSLESVS
jgi:hypothetical protein